ncbi:MAG: D-tagatose-bisphosphate aldolase, class II, non-catalytic subunit [Acidobacteriota bacterium]
MEKENNRVLEVVKKHKSGKAVGIYSICSANRFVLEAGMKQAERDESLVCIESTSNQVNQFGGYMGMKPADFVEYVNHVAAEMNFPLSRLILGGDHLGPHVWQNLDAQTAMAHASRLVRDYVTAGYSKIHLDASMRCADDPGGPNGAPDEDLVIERTALLCEVAESARELRPPGLPPPVYVIGTEVPIPGGEQDQASGLVVTSPDDASRTIQMTCKAFQRRGLEGAWERVVAVVVQPGVEFGDATVFEYDRHKAVALSRGIEHDPSLVFEAHSTDYQPVSALKQLVEDHFAILKVGPWLTFALREAVFALAAVERECLGGKRGLALSRIEQVLEESMLKDPRHWQKYYHGDEIYLAYARKYSYSDRIRYYWPQPEVQEALARLLTNLSVRAIPLPLLSQYLPQQYTRVREGRLKNSARTLIQDKIQDVLSWYAEACLMSRASRNPVSSADTGAGQQGG